MIKEVSYKDVERRIFSNIPRGSKLIDYRTMDKDNTLMIEYYWEVNNNKYVSYLRANPIIRKEK